ncbi:thiazole/oxazole-forming peptide maturase, SagD family component [Rhizobiales bacterium GAS188]|nr:thiazole/oxazole-forming peptide maturase, SagD family component [Rhizobiales bacterium GAS188]
MADLFLRSAAALSRNQPAPDLSDDVRAFLSAFEYLDGDRAVANSRARLLAAAATLGRLFRLASPDTPGLFFFGGEADPAVVSAKLRGAPIASVSGSGTTPAKAFESSVGEAVEYLSQYATEEDALERASFGEQASAMGEAARDYVSRLLESVGVSPDQPIDWVRAQRLGDGVAAPFPADICLRRTAPAQDFTAPFKLSTGCGAGSSFEAAALHGLLELIERDAASLWWRGGSRGRSLPAESQAMKGACELLTQMRGAAGTRFSWLLDITTDLGVPCMAAISARRDGFGFACGLSARLSTEAAAISAVLEMGQMELAHHIVEAKRHERGDAALNAGDLSHLERSTRIDTATCELLYPKGLAAPVAEGVEKDAARDLEGLVARLEAAGIEVFALNLTRHRFAIPVARVLSTQLQLEPSPLVTQRLLGAMRKVGESGAGTPEIALF